MALRAPPTIIVNAYPSKFGAVSGHADDGAGGDDSIVADDPGPPAGRNSPPGPDVVGSAAEGVAAEGSGGDPAGDDDACDIA